MSGDLSFGEHDRGNAAKDKKMTKLIIWTFYPLDLNIVVFTASFKAEKRTEQKKKTYIDRIMSTYNE